MLQVPFYNFKESLSPQMQNIIQSRFLQIMQENSFIEGPYNHAFEEKFAKVVNANFCTLVANGTDALEIALMANEVGPGDRVIVPAISFHASLEAVINVGASVVFADIDEETGSIDPLSIERLLQKYANIKAIMPVHLYGLPASMVEIRKIAEKYDVFVLEDGAQAHGAVDPSGYPVGSGDLVTFSFYPTKNLGAFGDAGAICFKNPKLYDKILQIRNHGRNSEGKLKLGRNSRCDHIQAAILDAKLDLLELENAQRRKVAQEYYEALKDVKYLTLIPEKYVKTSSWHLFPVLINGPFMKSDVMKFLNSNGIDSVGFYNHILNEFSGAEHFPGEWSNAKKWCQKVICLPFNPHLQSEQIQWVKESLIQFFSSAKEFVDVSKNI